MWKYMQLFESITLSFWLITVSEFCYLPRPWSLLQVHEFWFRLHPPFPVSISTNISSMLNFEALFPPVCFINLAFSAFLKKNSIDCLNFRVLYTGYVLILTMQVHYLLEECLFTLNKIGTLFLQFSVCCLLFIWSFWTLNVSPMYLQKSL